MADHSMAKHSDPLYDFEVLEIIARMDGVVVQIGTEFEWKLDEDEHIDIAQERKKNPRFDAICRSTRCVAPEGIILGEVEWACNAGAKIELMYCLDSDDMDLAGCYFMKMVAE